MPRASVRFVSSVLLILSLAVTVAGCASDNEEPPVCKSSRADREPRCSPPEPTIECPPCGAGEHCVVFFDGVCTQLGDARCVPSTCHECSAECDRALCGGGDPVNAPQTFTCMATPCVDLPAEAIGCYGP